MKNNIVVVSRNSYNAITKNHLLIDCLEGKDLFFIYSPRARELPNKSVAKEIHLVELRQSEAYISALTSVINSRYPIDYIVSVSEQDLLPAAAARTHLKLPGLDLETAQLFRNKLLMKSKLAGKVDMPDHTSNLSLENLRSFFRKHGKIIVKPHSGYGSQDCYVVNREEEIASVLEGIGDKSAEYFSEQFVDLPIYHFDALVRNGAVLFSSLGTYSHPPLQYIGSEWLVSVISNEESDLYRAALDMLKAITREFGVEDGVFHLEFFASKSEVYFGEIAIRPGGGGITDAIHRAWGVHLYEEHVRLQLQLPPKTKSAKHEVKHAANMIHYASKNGRVANLNVEQVSMLPNVVDVHVHVEAGTTIESARYSGDALFTVVVVSDTQGDLTHSIQAVMNRQVVEVAN